MNEKPIETWVTCHAQRPDLCYLRYTLEAHEGLCIATSLPGRTGMVRLLTTTDHRAELEQVLRAIAAEIPLQVLAWGTP